MWFSSFVENSKVIIEGYNARGFRVPDSNWNRIIKVKNIVESCRQKYNVEKQLSD